MNRKHISKLYKNYGLTFFLDNILMTIALIGFLRSLYNSICIKLKRILKLKNSEY